MSAGTLWSSDGDAVKAFEFKTQHHQTATAGVFLSKTLDKLQPNEQMSMSMVQTCGQNYTYTWTCMSDMSKHMLETHACAEMYTDEHIILYTNAHTKWEQVLVL